MIVNGYQTVEDRGDRDAVEADGPFLCTRADAWLGHGYYFWDSDVDRAHDWGRFAYWKFKKQYMIGQCELAINEGREENCFDLLGVVAHKKEIIALAERLLKTGNFDSPEQITVPKIIEFMKRNGLFPYRAIRAADYPPQPQNNSESPIGKVIYFSERRREGMPVSPQPRVQICVIDKLDVILTPFQVIFPEQ